ncbi:MAG: hypothetical protein Q4G03_10860 [Planctomycetia bacterium]|nr:hypothetical protein [Planctomycetia bacterium]
MSKLKLTQAATEQIARAVERCTEQSVHDLEPYADVSPTPVEIRYACLTSNWSRPDHSVWKATACFIDQQTGQLLAGQTFDVYCPHSYERPLGAKDSWRFPVAWLGRWESLQTNVTVPSYVAGAGIAIYASGASYVVENLGVLNIAIPGASGYLGTGTVYLSSSHFKHQVSTVEGKREIALKTKEKRIVVDVVDGEPVYETLTVLDV